MELKTDHEKIKNIPIYGRFCDEIEEGKFSQIQKLTTEYKIQSETHNLAAILALLEEEVLWMPLIGKNEKSGNIESDQREFLRYLETREGVTEILFKTEGSNFHIKDREVVNDILELLQRYYRLDNDSLKDYKERRKNFFSPNRIKKRLAHNLYDYLMQNTDLGKNKIYALIGDLFQLSGVERDLSEKPNHYSYISDHIYKRDRIKNKYFK